MQALLLMITYVVTIASVQGIGFLTSRAIEYVYPAFGLMAFLILFMTAFWIAWPVAFRVTEWLIRRAGYVIQTEQSGGEGRLDHLKPARRAAR